MMNERGKSDPAVVATKLANKAERSAAEPVEPRAGTKGNANQQHSGRTQSRETVSQVLARIRQTARERKKERFTALFHHINVELLRDAFFAIRREAAPGVDGVTWQDEAHVIHASSVAVSREHRRAKTDRLEVSYKGFEVDVWYGLTAPAKTPKEKLAQIAGWFTVALQAPEVPHKACARSCPRSCADAAG